MKDGINLATRAGRGAGAAATLGRLVVLAALVASGAHLIFFSKAHRRVAGLSAEVDETEYQLNRLDEQIQRARRSLETPAASKTVRQLEALEQTGTTRAVSPPAVMSLVADSLPPEAMVLSVKLKASPPEPELQLEAIVSAPDEASQLLGGIAGFPQVARAEILEERHAGEGEIYLRIEARLRLSEDDR